MLPLNLTGIGSAVSMSRSGEGVCEMNALFFS